MPGWLRLTLSGALLAGLFALAYHLGNQGTGGSLADLQTIGNGVDVAVLTSDPAVTVATTLTMLPPNFWELQIGLDGPPLTGSQVRRGNILIVLTSGLSLDSSVQEQLTRAGFAVKSYPAKQFPWTLYPAPATTVEAPFVATSTSGYSAGLTFLDGNLPPALVAHTSVGVDIAAPSVGQPFIGCPSQSRHLFCAVSAGELSRVVDGAGGWRGRQVYAPTQKAVLEALPTGNWSIIAANPPPRTQGEAWEWSDTSEILGRTVIHFSSTDQQASGQRDVLWSGVIFGIVGGVVATWLTSLATVFRRRPDADKPKPAPRSGSPRNAGRQTLTRLGIMTLVGILVAIRRLRG